MADEQAAPDRPRRIRTARFEAFSDGVFAIAITILVLEITVPAGSEDHLLRAFSDQWHSYLAYVVSFSTIGVLWLGHTGITEYLEGADAMLVRLNLLLLMVVSFIPFPTRLLAEYSHGRTSARVATTIYGITVLVASVLMSVLWRYAVREGLNRPDAKNEDVESLTKRLAPSLAGYLVMIALGLFVPIAAVAGYLLIALYLLVPFGLIRRLSRS
jgi:TMEM175 potassium channel family protein